MSILRPVVYDGQLQRQLAVGDVAASMESIPTAVTATTMTYGAATLSNGIVLRSPAAPATDTLDSAANLIAGISIGLGNIGIQPGAAWRVRVIDTTANAITVAATANTGVTVTNGTVNASSVKDFLLTVVNGSPAQTFAALTANASAVVSGLTTAQVATLTPGMIVTNAVANLQGQTILSVNQPAGTVTLSGTANASNTVPVAISFSPVVSFYGIGQGLL